MKIEILSRKSIKPSTPTPSHFRSYKLSLFDQLAPLGYVHLILYYSPNYGIANGIENAERSTRLERSLSEVLTKFYPLAGRIITSDELLVDCNDQGVDFLEAEVSGKLDEFLSRGPEVELLNQFVPEGEIDPADSTMSPLLAIQINNFKCGGLVIGVSVSHKLADASAFVTFINQWATASRVGIVEVASPSLDLAAHLPTRTLGFKPPPPGPKNSGPIFVMKRFLFTGASVQGLKDKVSRPDMATNKPSRVVVVTALLWKALICIARAKCGHLRGSIAIHMMDLRGKTALFIPNDPLGNLATVVITRFEAGEEKLELEDLAGSLGKSMRDSKASLATKQQGDEIYLMWFKLMEEVKKELIKKSELDYPKFSSWCRFPSYEADFGWGKPDWVSTARMEGELCILMDTRCGDGIEAWVNLMEEDMIELERDPDILAFTSGYKI